jgi:hypothetical protein
MAHDALTAIIRRVLARADAVVTHWEIRPLGGGFATMSGEADSRLFRVWGEAASQGDVLRWAVVLKTLAPLHADDSLRDAQAHASDPFYVWREVLAYQSGTLDDLPGGIAAPHCYAIVERPEGQTELWLEEIVDHYGPRWPPSAYAHAAYQLGRFNASYLVERDLPSGTWLSSGWLRGMVRSWAPSLANVSHLMDNPDARSYITPVTVERLITLWERESVLFDVLDALPQTFCHLDAFRRNLFIRAGGGPQRRVSRETVAIDWAYAGQAALGEEMTSFILSPFFMFDMELAELTALEEATLAQYLAGLRATGWTGAKDEVHLGYLASSALHFGVGILPGALLFLLSESPDLAAVLQVHGQSREGVLQLIAGLLDHALDNADAAMVLIDSHA